MKKLVLILFITLCCFGVAFSDEGKQSEPSVFNLEEYRSYPFQWVFPEHYYKADIIRVEKEKNIPQGFTKIEFFGLSAYIPSEYTEEVKRKNDMIAFKSKNEKITMIKSSNDSYMCSEKAQVYQKDYCSAFKTPQELFHKLYTLTPDMAENVGDRWIVYGKAADFKNVKNIKIYSGDKFLAYVMLIKDSLAKENKFSHVITLFHASGPLSSYNITISFRDNDDNILNHFISTIE
jgi:hypothetical protein